MNNTCRIACAYFDSIGFKYRVVDDEKSRLTVSFRYENIPSMDILVIFDDKNTVAIRAFNVVKNVSDKQIPAVLVACNELNHRYRWVKFYLDTNDNTVSIEDDAVVSLDTVGAEIHELVNRMADISDDAYPILMKAMYS